MTNIITPALLKYAELIRSLINEVGTYPRTVCACVHPKNVGLYDRNRILIILPYCTHNLMYNGDTSVCNDLVSTRLLPHSFNVEGLYPYTTSDAWTYHDGYSK